MFEKRELDTELKYILKRYVFDVIGCFIMRREAYIIRNKSYHNIKK